MTKDNGETDYIAQPNNISSLPPFAKGLTNMMARFPLPSQQLTCFSKHPSAFLSATNFYKPSTCFLFSQFKIKIHLRAADSMIQQALYTLYFTLFEGYTFQIT
jgi:hypothetical protein